GRPPQEEPNKVYDLPLGNSPVKGSMSAKATIVEFSDFQCPYCSKLQPTLKQVMDAYPDDVRLVFKQFPLDFHKMAKNASKASLAAGKQGKFWEMHDLIFEKHGSLTEAMFTEFAVKLGLDKEQFEKDYSSTKYDKQIQDEMNLGIASGVRGTPTLYLNGKKMGGRSFNDFKTAIDSILKK
ncbi:MAG TPA: DsbA family protein, partial [Nitrospirae bacterium]|nr:DsbA family protein [Nitrospirota bacterium]